MVLTANSLLYLCALVLAVTVTTPLPATASRGARLARAMLAGGGGLVISAAIALAFLGLWFESALAGTAAIVLVGVCMWVALARHPDAAAEEDEDEDDEGGSHFKPPAPEPTKPEGGPSDDFWADFDAARADWDRAREPTSA